VGGVVLRRLADDRQSALNANMVDANKFRYTRNETGPLTRQSDHLNVSLFETSPYER